MDRTRLTDDVDPIDADSGTLSANRDPISGEPGSHPVGTGIGAAGGVTTGAIIGGIVGGPIGGVIGAAIGGAVGGRTGHEVAEGVNPTDPNATRASGETVSDTIERAIPGDSDRDGR
jgi:phage tail tape-measure protein